MLPTLSLRRCRRLRAFHQQFSAKTLTYRRVLDRFKYVYHLKSNMYLLLICTQGTVMSGISFRKVAFTSNINFMEIAYRTLSASQEVRYMWANQQMKSMKTGANSCGV